MGLAEYTETGQGQAHHVKITSLNLLETAAQCLPAGETELPLATLEALAQQSRLNYEKDGDGHYDAASAFQKSLRGSDANAALYYLAKMMAAGEDPRFIARRLMVTAAEDVGNADPMAFVLAQAAANSVATIGFPEARIPLAQAAIYVAQAPKSNVTVVAIDDALADIQHRGHNYPVPPHLRDAHYKGAKDYGHGVDYHYTHDNPDKAQTFLPQALLGRQYLP